jgi:hypothetical protein
LRAVSSWERAHSAIVGDQLVHFGTVSHLPFAVIRTVVLKREPGSGQRGRGLALQSWLDRKGAQESVVGRGKGPATTTGTDGLTAGASERERVAAPARSLARVLHQAASVQNYGRSGAKNTAQLGMRAFRAAAFSGKSIGSWPGRVRARKRKHSAEGRGAARILMNPGKWVHDTFHNTLAGQSQRAGSEPSRAEPSRASQARAQSKRDFFPSKSCVTREVALK